MSRRKNGLVSGIWASLFLVAVFGVVLNVRFVSGSGTIYIKADGSVGPPTAPISSIDNLVYTFTGSINEPIVVERDNIVIEGAGYTVQGTGSGTGIDLSGRSNVTIRTVEIRAFEQGILLSRSSNNTIQENFITANNKYGILFYWSSNNNVSMNKIRANNGHGIWLDYLANGNSFSENNITANTFDGVWLYESYYNSIVGNNITANGEYGIRFVGSSGNNITGNTVTNNWNGVVIRCSSSNTVLGNSMTANNYYGVWLYESSKNNITENNITANGYEGVRIEWSSNYNSIAKNDIAANGHGIWLWDSSGNRIAGNNITANGYGIRLQSSSSNNIPGNNITANSQSGVMLSNSSSNSIIGNSVANNLRYGISPSYSSNNSIYHNNFINNPDQVHTVSSVNLWDDGYLSGGNYWSNYTGVDEKSGPNQDQPSSDGIGDTPHVIDANNRDNYPHTLPWVQLLDVTPPSTFHDYDGSWHTQDYAINLTAADDLSGIAKICYRIMDSPPKTVGADGQPRISIERANNTLEYWSIDRAGNEMLPHKILTGIKLDKTAPEGSLTINGDAAYTNSTSVTLTLIATDATSGVYQVRYGDDGVWDTELWETPSLTKTWALPSVDGAKTVYYQIRDNAGFLSPSYQDTIELDTIKPTAEAGIDQTVNEDTLVAFNASASWDEGGIISYHWNFGDGTDEAGEVTTHIYTSSGIYTVTLTVTDAAGNSAIDSITVTVLSIGPPGEAFPLWEAGTVIALVVIALAATIVWRRRKQQFTSLSFRNK